MWLSGRSSRPGALLTPDAMDVRSPTDGVMRTPLPLTPLPLTSPSLPSVNPMRCGCYAIVACAAIEGLMFIHHQAGCREPFVLQCPVSWDMRLPQGSNALSAWDSHTRE